MRHQSLLVVCVALLMLGMQTDALELGDLNEQRARMNYTLNCQGCHLGDGAGFPNKVPAVKNFMGHFLKVEGGREFLVQVPGAANAPVSDAELAELLNWMLLQFSRAELPARFVPYNADEVGTLRKAPLINVTRKRARLLQDIEHLVCCNLLLHRATSGSCPA